MFTKYAQFLLILAVTSLWAHKIPISTDTPYSSGEVLLASENDTVPLTDTIQFFGGIALKNLLGFDGRKLIIDLL
jgi:hypothetical protein